jgi:hypothetical protein
MQTERLREVEARIEAGRTRRQEHLQGIKVKQRRTREKVRGGMGGWVRVLVFSEGLDSCATAICNSD